MTDMLIIASSKAAAMAVNDALTVDMNYPPEAKTISQGYVLQHSDGRWGVVCDARAFASIGRPVRRKFEKMLTDTQRDDAVSVKHAGSAGWFPSTFV